MLGRLFIVRGSIIHVRDVEAAGLRDWLPEAEWPAVERSRSRPDAILPAIAAELRGQMRGGALSDTGYQILAERLMAMTTIQTACERLRSTPPPFTDTLLLPRTAWLFCLLLPFGLVALEEPFGTAQRPAARHPGPHHRDRGG